LKTFNHVLKISGKISITVYQAAVRCEQAKRFGAGTGELQEKTWPFEHMLLFRNLAMRSFCRLSEYCAGRGEVRSIPPFLKFLWKDFYLRCIFYPNSETLIFQEIFLPSAIILQKSAFIHAILYRKGQAERRCVCMFFSDKNRIVQIDINSIHPNPAQPRKSFNEQELLALSRSIRVNGLLQPITVRRVAGGYEIVAGERRLRACKMAGLETVSCIVTDCSQEDSAVLAMTENLQRQDLQIFEEAEGIRRLIEEWNVTQEEAAARLGKSQSTLANKMRLLKLSEAERAKIMEAGLTERHARALLRINDEKLRAKALDEIIERNMNVQQTDTYVERLLSGKKKDKNRRIVVVKDVRVFLNTINHAIETMKKSGINAQTVKKESEDYIECIVRIPKTEATAGGKKPA